MAATPSWPILVQNDAGRNIRAFSYANACNGEGSPYVMNRADAKRDPTVEPTKSNNTWGQIKVDYGKIEYNANLDYGAYVLYEALMK